jgi:hypothetical protein
MYYLLIAELLFLLQLSEGHEAPSGSTGVYFQFIKNK